MRQSFSFPLLLTYNTHRTKTILAEKGLGTAMGGCGCNSGGKKSVMVKDSSTTSTGLSETNLDSLVLMEFIGSDTNSRTLRSKFRRSDKYRYSVDENHFNAYRADVPWLVSLGIFKVVEESLSESPLTNELLPLESYTAAPDFSEIPIDVLPLDSVILANLKKNDYTTLGRVKMASDGELLALKGMGDKRLKDLRNALNAV